jgi:hypothetical protein
MDYGNSRLSRSFALPELDASTTYRNPRLHLLERERTQGSIDRNLKSCTIARLKQAAIDMAILSTCAVQSRRISGR